MKTIKGEIDTILRGEIEEKQQALNTIHTVRDPQSGQLEYNTAETERIFKDYYKDLYTQLPSSSEEAKTVSQLTRFANYWKSTKQRSYGSYNT